MVWFTGQYRIVGPLYWNCCMSPFWCLDFALSSVIFVTFLDPWLSVRGISLKNEVKKFMFTCHLVTKSPLLLKK